MIKIPVNHKVIALSRVLDTVIADYNKLMLETKAYKQIGMPEDNPKLSEADLIAQRRIGDVTVAKDVFAYYIEKFDENKVKASAANLFSGNKLLSISGRFHYPPGGFMGWHTNSNMEGWRVYATRCEEDNKSYFRYYKNGKTITEWEQKGWNFRAFEVKKGNLYWHCVYTDADRYSFGFRFGF